MKSSIQKSFTGIAFLSCVWILTCFVILYNSTNEELFVDAINEKATPILPTAFALHYLTNIRSPDKTYRTPNGQTLIMFAAAAHNPDDPLQAARVQRALEALSKIGADLDALDGRGLSVLHQSVLANNPTLTKLLLHLGASPKTKAGPGKWESLTPQEFAMDLTKTGDRVNYEAVIKLLSDK
jgi:hypothetical protein